MKIKDLEELEMYVFLLEDLYQEVITEYSELVRLLNKEFNLDCTIKDIQEMYEPTVHESRIDLELQARNIWS